MDIAGKQFGDIFVESFAYTKQGSTYWNCICGCGKKFVASGNTKSCGCSRGKHGSSHPFFKDISGKTFGNLTALKPLDGRYWLFHCIRINQW